VFCDNSNAIRLISALALVVSACALHPEASNPADANQDASQRVSDVLGVVKKYYVTTVDEQTLADACRRELPEDRTSTQMGNADVHSFKEIAAVLDRMLPLDAEFAADRCIRGMMARLGGHSEFLSVDEFRLLRSGGGVGLYLVRVAEGAKVVALMDGTLAASAGLEPGDVIIAIDGTDVRGRAIPDVARLLRGDPGSEATLTIRRGNEAQPLRIGVRREQIRPKPLDGWLLEPGIVYLKVLQLGEATPAAMVQTIVRLRDENKDAFRGVILDLRACPGGLMHESVTVAAAFLPTGAFVTELRGRSSDSNQRFLARKSDYLRRPGKDPLVALPAEMKSAPLVVLTGPNTAAGAEIIASALQDQKRATVIGTRTFGRASIETIIPMTSGSAIKLTTARAYRLNGQTFDGVGVDPDMFVEPDASADDRPPLSAPAPDDAAVAQALADFKSGTNRIAARPATPHAVLGSIDAREAVSIEAAFAKSKALPAGKTAIKVEAYPERLPVITIGDQKLIVVPLANLEGGPRSLAVRSYVIRLDDGSYGMFYPVVSLIDNDFRISQTLTPKYEFAFDGTSLLNEFDVPAGTARLLIHTDQRFHRGSFETTQSTPDSRATAASTLTGTMPLAGLALTIANAISGTNRNQPVTFKFSEVGALRIEAQ